MTTRATDLVYAATKYYGATGAATYQGLTKREYAAAVILNGLLRDADNVGALTDSQLAVIAVARADAALTAAGATGTDLAFPPEEFRKVSLPAAARKTGITKLEEYCINLMSGFQGDNISIDALNPAPGSLTDALAGVGAGLVEHITVPTAPTGALAATPIAGNVNIITVPIAPTAALAGAGAGNVDSVTVPIAPTAALAGVAGNVDNITVPIAPTQAMGGATPGNVDHITVPIAPTQALGGASPGNVDHITVPIAPTMVEGAAGLVDIGDHYYVVTYVTADGETTMGAVSAIITIAAAAKHVTVTIPVSPFVGVTQRNIYRSKIAGGHAVRGDFFLVGNVADNTTLTLDDNLAEAGMPATNPPAANTAAGYEYCVTYVTADGETTMGAVSAAPTVIADKTVDGQVTVTIPVSPFVGVTSRKVYRCKAGTASTSSTRTHYFLVATVANNTDLTVVDNVAEAAVGANPPAANNAAKYEYVVTYVTADGETVMGAVSAAASTVANKSVDGQIVVTIPVSPYAGVTGRNVYRCKAGTVATSTTRTHYFKVATVANNTDLTVTDNIAEAAVGANPPATDTAAGFKYVVTYTTADGASTMGAVQAVAVVVADKSANGQVTVTIPVSAQAGVSGRKVYRCKAGTAATSTLRTHFFKVADVGNNVDVTYVDNIADSALGASPPAANNGAQYKYLVVYEAEDGTQTSIGAIQAAATTVADKTADGKVTVTIPVSSEAGVAKRLVYRSKLGQAKAARTDFFLAATVANNTDVTVTDNVAESGLGANPPAANGTGGHKYIITFETADGETTMGALSAAITVADESVNGQVELVVAVSAQPGVTKRTIYRSKAGVVPSLRTHFFKVGSIANNTGTAYTDNVADSGLGANAPATNNAGNYTYKVTHLSPSGESEAGAASGGVYVSDKAANGKIALSAIPTGPAGTTARNIYRTKCGYGSLGPWYYHSQIADNTTATATDNTPDSGLTVGTTAPSADTAWAGILGVDIADKAAKLATQMGSSANDPIIPYRWYVASGAEVRQGLTKEEFFAEAAESGFISDSVNIGVLSNAQLATKGDTLSAALIVALN